MENKERARTLGNKEAEARNAKRMETWRSKRIQQRTEIAAEVKYFINVFIY